MLSFVIAGHPLQSTEWDRLSQYSLTKPCIYSCCSEWHNQS